MCWAGVKFKTPLTKRRGEGEKPTKPTEKGEKPENKNDNGKVQSIPSILKPYSTSPEEKNENKKEKLNERKVEYKPSIDGIDCDSPIAVKKIKFVMDYKTDLPGKPYEVVPAGFANSDKIRVAAFTEFGMAGWVDPAKLAHALKLPIVEVEAWLQSNYVAYDRPNGGGIGYRQRRAGEAKA